MPVVHCHAMEAQGVPAEGKSGWQLVQHIAVCHAGEHDHGHELGWHVHFVLPTPSNSHVPHESPLESSALAEFITHTTDSHFDAPVSSQAANVLADFVVPLNQPTLTPTAPKLIPLAPPRHRPNRVSPRIYYCVAQC